MEGRPPSFDSDDELDFDFESSRRRHPETGEQPLPRAEDVVSPYEGEELPSEEYPPTPEDDPFARERAQRPRRGRGGVLSGLRLGRRRERGERRPARAAGEGEAPSTETGERLLRDDPYTPAEVPVPGVRRQRRRDLPAKVRRRQTIALGAVGILLVGGVALVFGGGGGGDDEEPLGIKKLIGQTIVAPWNAERPPSQKLVRRARRGQIGGVIVTASGGGELSEQVVQQGLVTLQQAAEQGGNPALLAMVDQEGGRINRLPGPPEASPPELGRDEDPAAARAQGEQAGAYLRPLGIEVDLAPVLDVELPRTADTIADRTFGEDPALVADLGAAFIQGIQSRTVAATAKHFPGLGTATLNTDFSPTSVVATQEEFDGALEPFRAAIEAGVQLVMMSSAAYPNLAGSAPGEGRVVPAVFAPPIVRDLLRNQLGFRGLIITDDLESVAIKELTNRDVAAVSALGAGCDLALYARSERGSVQGFNAVLRATKRDTLTRERLQQSYDRIVGLKQALGSA